MAYFCRLIASFMMLLVSQSAMALLSPGKEYQTSDWSSGVWSSSPAAACARAIAYINHPEFSILECTEQVMVVSRNGAKYTQTAMYSRVASCPANSVASGAACACNAGFEEKNGQCIPIPKGCPAGQHEQGGACVPDTCKAEQVRVNGLCVDPPPCPAGQTRINGVCRDNGCTAGKQTAEIGDANQGSPAFYCEKSGNSYCTIKVSPQYCVSYEGITSCAGVPRMTGSSCSPPSGVGNPGSNPPAGGDSPGGGSSGNGGSNGGTGDGTGGTGSGTGTGGTGGGTGSGSGGSGGGTGSGTGNGTGTGGGTGNGTGTGGGTGSGTGTGTGTGTGGGTSPGSGGNGTGTGGNGSGTGGNGTGGNGSGTGGTGGGGGGGGGGNGVPPPNPNPPGEDGKCSAGFSKGSDGQCYQNPVPPDSDGKCPTGTVKIKDACVSSKPGDGEDDEDEDESHFGGSCQAGFTCEGDALQCAIAREQHKRNCEVFEKDSDENSLFNKALNGTDEGSAENLKSTAQQVSIGTFDQSGLGWSTSCPADPSIPLNFGGSSAEFTIPFSRICGPLGILSVAGVGITLLGCMVWVLGGKKSSA